MKNFILLVLLVGASANFVYFDPFFEEDTLLTSYFFNTTDKCYTPKMYNPSDYTVAVNSNRIAVIQKDAIVFHYLFILIVFFGFFGLFLKYKHYHRDKFTKNNRDVDLLSILISS